MAHLIYVTSGTSAAAPLIATRVLLLLLLLLLRQAVAAAPAAHAWVIPHAAAAAAADIVTELPAVLTLPAVLAAPVLTAGEPAVVGTARGPATGGVRGCAACGAKRSTMRETYSLYDHEEAGPALVGSSGLSPTTVAVHAPHAHAHGLIK